MECSVLLRYLLRFECCSEISNYMFLTLQTDQYVLYYNSAIRSLKLFRRVDATQLANYVIHAEVRSINTSYDGRKVLLGTADGALTCLAISDPGKKEDYKHIRNMKSRKTGNRDESEDD